MTCLAVRDLLAEHAIAALPAREARLVERHLAWCAACRKEARDLQEAAGVLALALPSAAPPGGLEERVVGRVLAAASRRPPQRRGRSALAAILAAAIACSGLVWGAVMARRADEFEHAAREAARRQSQVAERLQLLLETAPFADAADQTRVVPLTPVGAEPPAGGAAVLLVSPRRLDLAVVLLSGLDPADEAAFPYRIVLVGARDRELPVGKVRARDVGADGTADEAREFVEDLSVYAHVVVEDASGAVVLRGEIAAEPSPGA